MAQCSQSNAAGSAANVEPQEKRKVALITGITGQDGSYLAEFLIEKGYMVHGILRRSSSFNTGRIQHLYKDPCTHTSDKMALHYGDLTDSTCLVKIINEVKPTEIYNLGAQSHVKISFDLAEYTANVDGVGTLRLLDAIKTCGLTNSVRFYQASTSELYGKVLEIPQKETTPFYPRSPYGAAKLYAYWIVVNFREAYNMFAVNGILFNHESPRRGPGHDPSPRSGSAFLQQAIGFSPATSILRVTAVVAHKAGTLCCDVARCPTAALHNPVWRLCWLDGPVFTRASEACRDPIAATLRGRLAVHSVPRGIVQRRRDQSSPRWQCGVVCHITYDHM
ncbi:unnamed protein product, partial [Pleuronectes platessa]